MVSIVGGQEVHVRVTLILRECIWNEFAASLVFLPFDNTGSLDYPRRQVVYHPLVSTLVTASRFLVGNRETELKSTTFFSLLLFRGIDACRPTIGWNGFSHNK